MKKYFLGISTLCSVLTFSMAAIASPIGPAKAAEFGLHRVERLVLQKKADAGYLSHLHGMTIEALTHQNETDPAFKVIAYQYSAADGSRRNIEIVLNESGKPITAEVKTGGEPVNFPTWPAKDALTLCEGAIHYLLEHSASDARLKLYADKLTQFSISLGKNAQGQDVAVVDVVGSEANPVLKIFVKFDGSVDTVAFAQR